MPETRATVLVTREAKRRRKAGEPHVYSTSELVGSELSVRHVLTTWARPFEMFVREPIVLWLSLLSGFSDALIFTFLESYSPVFQQWGFTPGTTGLAFIPIMVGYFVAWASFVPWIRKDVRERRRNPDKWSPERRLYWLLWSTSPPLLPSSLSLFDVLTLTHPPTQRRRWSPSACSGSRGRPWGRRTAYRGSRHSCSRRSSGSRTTRSTWPPSTT